MREASPGSADAVSSLLHQKMYLKIKSFYCGKIVLRRLRSPDHPGASVLLQENLRTLQLAVVIISHGKSMGAGIVDHQQIAHINLRQHPVNGKLVVVLAERTDHIILVIARFVSLPMTVI